MEVSQMQDDLIKRCRQDAVGKEANELIADYCMGLGSVRNGNGLPPFAKADRERMEECIETCRGIENPKPLRHALSVAKMVYQNLMNIPASFRPMMSTDIQKAMTGLRDFISEMTGKSPEEIEEEYRRKRPIDGE
jgi:hypothetical protein